MRTAADFPPHVLREYAFLGDGERGAVIGPRGEISWLCAPRWDSPSVFGHLLGAAGLYAVTPRGRFVWGGYYEADCLIWRSRWVTDTGIVECREALAMPADPHRLVLLRRVEPVNCTADVGVLLEPAGDYGDAAVRDVRCVDGVWEARVADLYLRWSGAAWAERGERGWRGSATADEERAVDLVLELGDRPFTGRPQPADELWRATERTWADAVPRLASSVTPADARHAYAVMRGMTARGGGMVAAATTSLPERADAGRSYDYRYVWIRDQCFAGQAVAADGGHPLLDDAVGFVTERILADGPDLAPAYTTSAGRVPDQRNLSLPGYPGGGDVVGNHVNGQFQLDTFGEALLLFTSAASVDRSTDDSWAAAEVAAAAIKQRWTEPDAGIWELSPAEWTHSRLVAVAGLDALVAARPRAAKAGEWRQTAERIRSWLQQHALRPDGALRRAAGDDGLDGALILAGIRGAAPPTGPAGRATLDAYLRELTKRGYAYRFRPDDRPLGESEGSFLLCGFATAIDLHRQGRAVEAGRWFERTRASAGAPQLFSEEFDATQHQLRGNLPQAFVHAFLLQASLELAHEPHPHERKS